MPGAADSERIPLLIVGLGNVLLMDDGVGVHAVRALASDPPPGALLVEVGTAVLDALHVLEGADVVLALDAVQAGGTPGTIYRLNAGEVGQPGPSAALHELNLLAALRLLPPGRRPAVIVLGVEPACIDYGVELSPAVQAVMPEFVALVRRVAAASGGLADRSGG